MVGRVEGAVARGVGAVKGLVLVLGLAGWTERGRALRCGAHGVIEGVGRRWWKWWRWRRRFGGWWRTGELFRSRDVARHGGVMQAGARRINGRRAEIAVREAVERGWREREQVAIRCWTFGWC